MVPGSKNISPMERGALFLAANYATSEKVISPFILTVAAVLITCECLRICDSVL
jgi:hypothetical protein